MDTFDLRLLLLLVPAAAGLIGQRHLRSVFNHYSNVDNWRGASGEEVAQELLSRHRLGEISIERVPGKLKDHYDSEAGKLRLSERVAEGRSIASLGIAAHEVGHALQDTESSRLLQVRSHVGERLNRLTPYSGVLLVGGLWFGIPILMALMGAFLVGMAVFSAVTLPVELNASRRALHTLEEYGMTTAEEMPAVRRVLRAAALTYVASLAHRLGLVLFILLGVIAAGSVS